MDPEDALYVCTLSECSAEKARRELFEDPQQRLGAVQTLRAWVRAQPHFTSRVDTTFLLQVLRTAKFSQLRAREIIENIVMMRAKCPELMVSIDTHEPGLLAFIDTGVIVPLPKRDAEGRLILLIRYGMADPADARMSVANNVRANLAVQELLKEEDEGVVVNGMTIVVDFTRMTSRHLARFLARDAAKNMMKIQQECSRGRMKAAHYYNAGALFEIAMGVVKPLLKKKFTERLHVHDTMESLYKVIPMSLWPDEYLPDDYKGPSAGPIASISDEVKRRLMEPGFRARMMAFTSDTYRMDESKRPRAAPQESFRKLNID